MLQSYIPNNNTTTLVIEDTDAAYLLMLSRLSHFEVFDWSKQQSNWINQQWIGLKGTPMTKTKCQTYFQNDNSPYSADVKIYTLHIWKVQLMTQPSV